MPGHPNKRFLFLQELKRRKVFRVIAMYAGTAFVIMEAADIILPRLGLPDWTVTFLIILLIAGFPIAIVLSWIFEITPGGVKKTESIEADSEPDPSVSTLRSNPRVGNVIIIVLILAVCVLLYPRVFKRDSLKNVRDEDGRISVAVMPFQNMTNDSTWNIWENGIQNELITSLTNAAELKVRQPESIRIVLQSKDQTGHASLVPSMASSISRQLDASVYIFGTIKEAGDMVRLNAQIIDSKTEETFKSFQVEGAVHRLMFLIDSLSMMVKNYLIISELQKKVKPDMRPYLSTLSPEAYRYYMMGEEAFKKYDFPSAMDMLSMAIAQDSNFAMAYQLMASSYANQGNVLMAKEWFGKADNKKEYMSSQQQIFAKFVRALFLENPNFAIKYGRQLQEIDDQSPLLYYNIGEMFNSLELYDHAITEFEKCLDIYAGWGSKPGWGAHYTGLGYAYHKTGQFSKEKKLYEIAEKDFPDDPGILYRQAVLSLSEGENSAASEFLEKFRTLLKNNFSAPDGNIATMTAFIYGEADLLDEAEKYHRQAIALDPANPDKMEELSWFLIDTGRGVDEGIQLAEMALKNVPDYFIYLDTKGWGLYKNGNYTKAYDCIAKADSIQPGYFPRIAQHLEEVKKVAVVEN